MIKGLDAIYNLKNSFKKNSKVFNLVPRAPIFEVLTYYAKFTSFCNTLLFTCVSQDPDCVHINWTKLLVHILELFYSKGFYLYGGGPLKFCQGKLSPGVNIKYLR